MKKLYFLDEEEKGRILNLHESATKKQYLSEETGAVAIDSMPKTETGTIEAAIADPAKKAERIKNISRIVCSLKGDKITNKNSQFNGKSWVDYVTSQQITSQEEAQARKLCSTGGDERLYNISKIVCSVDDSGKIIAPNSKLNGTMFTDYIRTYKLTSQEVEKAKTLCGKPKPAGVKDSSTNVGGKTKSSVSTLTPRVQSVQKQLGIQNGTGTIDAATLQTLLTKLNGGVQAAAPAAGTMASTQQQMGTTSDQLNDTIKQLQANANRPA